MQPTSITGTSSPDAPKLMVLICTSGKIVENKNRSDKAGLTLPEGLW
jgi:hypothetical protein